MANDNTFTILLLAEQLNALLKQVHRLPDRMLHMLVDEVRWATAYLQPPDKKVEMMQSLSKR